MINHRWTPYVAPFPASHSGKNISLGLDTMIEELGLDAGQWELFSVKQGEKITIIRLATDFCSDGKSSSSYPGKLK